MTNSNIAAGPPAGAVVVIAGAGRGIGEAVARDFARRGCRLALVSQSYRAEKLADELSSRTETIGIQCDIADYGAVAAGVKRVIERWGVIDVLVNAAAMLGPTGDFWTLPPDQWKRTVDVDLCGTFNLMRAVTPGMVALRSGKIVNFAGGGAAYGYPQFSAYGCSKAAVVRLTETAALELAEHNVQVNVIAPGAIDTVLLRQVRAAGGEVGTIGRMEDAVRLVAYLASNEAGTLSARFIHAHDDYWEFPADMDKDLYTLRRVRAGSWLLP